MAVEGGPIAQAAVELVAEIGRFDDDAKIKITAAASAAGKGFDQELKNQTKNTGKDVGDKLSKDLGKSGKDAGGSWGQAFRIAIASALTRKALNAIFAPLRVAAAATGIGILAAEAGSAVAPILAFAGSAAQAVGVVNLLPAAISVAGALFGTLKVATAGMGDAFSAAASGDAKKLEESLKTLAPEAANVVREFAAVQPRLQEIKKTTQGALFGPLQGQLTSLVATLSGPVQGGMSQVAGSLARVAVGVADVAREGATVRFVSEAFATTSRIVDRLSPGLVAVVRGFRDLAAIGLPILERLSGSTGDLLESFGLWLTHISDSGKATAWINTALQRISELGNMILSLGQIIAGVFRAAQTASGSAFGTIGALLDRVSTFVNSVQGQTALVSLFQGLAAIAAVITPILLQLIGLIGQVAPMVGQLATALGPGLAAAVQLLGVVVALLAPVLTSVATALSQAFTDPAFQVGLAALVAGIGAVLVALTPLLPAIAQLAGTLATILGAALLLVAPLVRVLAEVLNFLAPVLSVIAVVLAGMAVPLLAIGGPILAVVGALWALNKVLAAVKIAWLVLNIAFALSPIGLIIVLVAGLVAGFIYLWNTSEGFRNFFIGAWNLIKTVVGAVVDWLLGALTSVGAFFTSLPGLAGSALSALGGIVLTAITAIGGFFASLPGMLLDALLALPGLLGQLLLAALNAVLFLIGAAIGLIILLIWKLPQMAGEGLVALGPILLNAFTTAWNWALNATVAAGMAIWTFATVTLPQMIVGGLAALGSMIGGAFAAAWTWAWDATVATGTAIWNFALALPGQIGGALLALPGIIGGAFVAAWNWARQAAIDGANAVVGFIYSVPGRIAAFGGAMLDAGVRLITAFFDGLRRVGGFAGDVAAAIVSGLRSGLNSVIASLNSGIRSVWPSFAGSPPQIPSLAMGAIVTHRMIAEIGEAGPEVVIPLTKPARAAELAEKSGLVRLLADRGLLGQAQRDQTTPARQVHVHAPITVHTVVSDPLLVARRAADHVTLLAQT